MEDDNELSLNFRDTARTSNLSYNQTQEPTPREEKEKFEVPEFLYKFSSTFFKKSSAKEKKINTLFKKVGPEKERNKINLEITSERDVEKPGLESNTSKQFKKVDMTLDNIKLRRNMQSPIKGKHGHIRYTSSDQGRIRFRTTGKQHVFN